VMMAEWWRVMQAWRPVRVTTRAKEARMSSSGWRRLWCARGGEECEDGKGFAGESRDGELTGGEEDDRFGLLPC
jgi:hypothetical protein